MLRMIADLDPRDREALLDAIALTTLAIGRLTDGRDQRRVPCGWHGSLAHEK